jgi:glycosyltransferase involved in cell wall biosynthesis
MGKPLIANGLWIGSHLSKLELLTLLSFTRLGHPFHLWTYDELDAPVPEGVTIRDASAILPRERIFLKSEADPSAGVGRMSYGPFSDLFRYKLLYEVGGLWVDMDVTCLRPFSFEQPYLFRSHPIGVIGNLMLAPPKSRVMRLTFEMADRIANESVSWLALNHILSQNVHACGLGEFVRSGLCNEGRLLDNIVDFAGSSYRSPPAHWYAIHWGNEFWGTVANSTPSALLPAQAVSKDSPAPGSTLHELYRAHGLVEPMLGHISDESVVGPSKSCIQDAPHPRITLNMFMPTLVRGGAERIAADLALGLAGDENIEFRIFVRKRSAPEYSLPKSENIHVTYLSELSLPGLPGLVLLLAKQQTPVLFTHLIPQSDLSYLWKAGVSTVPVLHNSRKGWVDNPKGYKHTGVPFVVACADFVKEEAVAAGCSRPVITIRHEIQRWPSAAELTADRTRVRAAWGLTPDVFVIGMVGQFKTQKAYTRAVRVLARIRQFTNAKLMIVGGWNHNYGAGRAAYEAAMRLAVELGVVADLIPIGNADEVNQYFAAFDVYLNTSLFEGLSIALLEAIAAGCPIVASAVGGVREVLPTDAVLVEDPADTEAYTAAVLRATSNSSRFIPAPPPVSNLIPQLWAGLGRTASAVHPQSRPRYGTMFVTDRLDLDGPTISLLRLVTGSVRRSPVAVFLATAQSDEQFAERLTKANATVYQAPRESSLPQTAQSIIDMALGQNFRTLCFWNTAPEIKLFISKLLEASQIQLVDVSPGPMLFDELDAAVAFQNRIAFTADQYWSRLNRFVAPYRAGIPTCELQKSTIIRLGVPGVPSFIPIPPAPLLLDAKFDPNFRLGTITRLVPDKRIDFLLDMMVVLNSLCPEASLTVVGGPDVTSVGYFLNIRSRASDLKLDNVIFVGPYSDVNRFIARWKVFVLAGERQGCPNASLEAMAMGRPVVAMKSGGLNEQVINGRTGYLTDTPSRMAEKVNLLLQNESRRERMGALAKAHVEQKFSLNAMVKNFGKIFDL